MASSLAIFLFLGVLSCAAAVPMAEISTVSEGFPYHALPHVESDLSADSVISDEWAVKLREDMDVHQLAHEHGYDVHGPVGKIDRLFLFKEKEDRRRKPYPHLNTSQHVEWAEQQVYRLKYRRDITTFSDPVYSQQWHIHETGKDMNVRPVWDQGYQGAGCQVAVVDDALQHENPDIKSNYDSVGSYDFNYKDPDPDSDQAMDTHGTSAAGCAMAAHNSICGVGAAPEATVAGIRLISRMATDVDEAAGLSYEYNRNHVYSNSWGPNDDGKTMEGPGRALNAAFSDAIQHGRGGKGTVYVWAGGNGKGYGDNGNMDGYNNRPYTISIGSYGYDLQSAWYSEECACLHAVSPSSGRTGPKIFTTSQNNQNGRNCRGDFGGTSASAPMVAGVMCLVLGAYPDLTWRDLQHIVVKTAKPVDATSSSWQTNGAGLKFSHSYGFGKIDADAMLTMAADWEALPAQVYADSGEVQIAETVAKGRSESFQVRVMTAIQIEHVSLYVDVEGISRGDLTVRITSPSGSYSKMVERSNDSHYGMRWIMSSNAHWGENAEGMWEVTFGNGSLRSTLMVNSYELLIDGTPL